MRNAHPVRDLHVPGSTLIQVAFLCSHEPRSPLADCSDFPLPLCGYPLSVHVCCCNPDEHVANPPPCQMPGASYRLAQEMLVRLSCSSDPTLEPLRAAAVALYSAQEPEHHAAAASTGGAEGPRAAGGGSGMSTRTPQRNVPDMGPLGEFLLGRWREEEAHELVLLARSRATGGGH